MSELSSVTIKEIKAACRKMWNDKNARNYPINVMGPPGVGKTDLFSQLAEEWGATYSVFLTATMDPTDVVGIPHEKDGITHFCAPKDWIALTENCHRIDVDPQIPMVAILEDLPACQPQVFNSLLRVICNGEVAGSKLRNNVLIGATGNRVEDRAGAAQIPSALANRFIHFEVKTDRDEWVHWGTQNKVNPYVISFVESKGPTGLHNFDPSSGFLAYPTPRSVTMASRMIDTIGTDEKELDLVLSGCCGKGWASEFIAFFRIREKIIPIDEIYANPSKARVPKDTDIDIIFSTVNNLIGDILNDFSIKKAEAFMKYIQRFGSEECILFGLKKFLKFIVGSDKIDAKDQRAIINSKLWEKLSELYHLVRDAQ